MSSIHPALRRIADRAVMEVSRADERESARAETARTALDMAVEKNRRLTDELLGRYPQ